ncbi:MAG: HNH endonuclease [Nocardioides sp.]
MPGWIGSDRKAELPPDWERTRRRILRRDGGRCTWTTDYKRCREPATDVDHRTPGDDHSDENLRSLCAPHHRSKSGREGAAAMHQKRRTNAAKFRRDEEHPGLL